MDNIHSISQESLLLLKDKISKYAPATTVEEVMKYVEKVVVDNGLNTSKLVDKLITAINTAGEIRSPYYFIKKVCDNLVRDHIDEVKDSKLKLAFTPLWLDMKKNNFTGNEKDYVLITLIEEHCFYEFPIEPSEIVETNHAIMDYCLTHNIRTYEGFKDLLLRSKLLKKCNVPLVILEDKATKQVEERDKLMAELNTKPEELDPFNAND